MSHEAPFARIPEEHVFTTRKICIVMMGTHSPLKDQGVFDWLIDLRIRLSDYILPLGGRFLLSLGLLIVY